MTLFRLYLTLLLLAPLSLHSAYSQVKTCSKVKKAGTNSLNFGIDKQPDFIFENDLSVRIVFSDRNNNRAYADAYAQQEREMYAIGAAYFVIGEKNDAYELVAADFNLLGKPKTLFSFLLNPKYRFKDARNTPYIGWIPKERLIHFNHSFLHPDNQKPMKYRIGVKEFERLFSMHQYFAGDTLRLFADPYLKEKLPAYVLLNQVVYPYKFDKTRKAVFISDKPLLSDTATQIQGWIPADLIASTGQNFVGHIIDDDTPIVINQPDTLRLSAEQLHKQVIYRHYGNAKTFLKQDTAAATLPLLVWDHSENKLINIKGGNLPISEISRMERENKKTNLHFIFFEDDKHDIVPLLNALQNIRLQTAQTPHISYTYSATCVSPTGNYHLPATPLFAVWLDYIANIVSQRRFSVQRSAENNLENAIRQNLKNYSPSGSFENNLFIVLGTNQDLNIAPQLIDNVVRQSGKFLFVQIKNQLNASYQDFLLLAKEALDNSERSYHDYMSNFIVEHHLVKSGGFARLDADNTNIFLYDAPARSLVNGGMLFPQTGKVLTNTALDVALDSLIVKTRHTDNVLLESLKKFERELGVLRSKPSTTVERLFEKEQIADSLHIGHIDRNSINDVYYKQVMLRDSLFGNQEQACLLTEEEIKELLQDYHSLVPIFADSVRKKELRVLKKIYRKQVKLINRSYKRSVVGNGSNLADLFYYKTGIPVYDSRFLNTSIRRLTNKKTVKGGFHLFYDELIRKLNRLEELFINNKLPVFSTPDGYYYYVPDYLLL